MVTRGLQLWLVRHGATDWSDAGWLNGWTDVPLNESGRAQARGLAATLDSTEFTRVWSSDLRRATETAKLAVGRSTPDRRLRELDFGRLEGLTWEQCPPDAQRALRDFDGFHAPDGESVAELSRRVRDFVAALTPGEHLVFTHGGVIRVLLRDAGSDARVMPGDVVRISVQQPVRPEPPRDRR